MTQEEFLVGLKAFIYSGKPQVNVAKQEAVYDSIASGRLAAFVSQGLGWEVEESGQVGDSARCDKARAKVLGSDALRHLDADGTLTEAMRVMSLWHTYQKHKAEKEALKRLRRQRTKQKAQEAKSAQDESRQDELCPTDEELTEGRPTQTTLTRYERSQRLRQRCLQQKGYRCAVCGMDFESVYGEIGRGYIEVHHVRPISTYNSEHEVPDSELVPLCSNCHAMIHRAGSDYKHPISVEELRNIIHRNG